MSNYADAIPARDDPRLPSMVSWRDPVDAGAAATSEDRWYLVIDEDGDVSVEKRTYYGDNATSEYEWHQRTLAYRILGDVIDDQRLRTALAGFRGESSAYGLLESSLLADVLRRYGARTSDDATLCRLQAWTGTAFARPTRDEDRP